MIQRTVIVFQPTTMFEGRVLHHYRSLFRVFEEDGRRDYLMLESDWVRHREGQSELWQAFVAWERDETNPDKYHIVGDAREVAKDLPNRIAPETEVDLGWKDRSYARG